MNTTPGEQDPTLSPWQQRRQEALSKIVVIGTRVFSEEPTAESLDVFAVGYKPTRTTPEQPTAEVIPITRDQQ